MNRITKEETCVVSELLIEDDSNDRARFFAYRPVLLDNSVARVSIPTGTYVKYVKLDRDSIIAIKSFCESILERTNNGSTTTEETKSSS